MARENIQIQVTEDVSIKGAKIIGKNKGKTLLVTAGVHGCEYVGIQALRELIKEIDDNELFGDIIIIPVVNESGFYNGIKYYVKEDFVNLNQAFGDYEKNSITYKMARAIEKVLYRQVDFILDLHSGDINGTMTPLLFFPIGAGKEMEDITRNVAKKISVGYRVCSRASKGLYSYANRRGVPSILIERGQLGMYTKEEIVLCKNNVYEVLDYLGIKKYEYTKNETDVEIIKIYKKNLVQFEIENAVYEEAVSDGFWECYKKPNDEVFENEILGVLCTCDGQIIQQVRAKYNGVFLYSTISLGVKKGEDLLAYGQKRN
ncbi:MAG: succinylglutamate desuccinylase/aspartoacylase family protein [Peptostreptococcaceae bacterium]|jgi:succinylglutamate desuccinylase/aspartoacylase|nr:succinylglutamate desuccinylase/aspartoacylase family protein [Peptostreptococcaceae bacterium]